VIARAHAAPQPFLPPPSYGNRELFDDTSLTVEKGHRVAIIGPNGVGKSTILRLVMGLEKAWSGKAAITASNVEANYFEQNQADALALDQTVDETVVGASSTESYNQLRALMAQFMFKGDSIYKKVAQLSGGEKARLAMCKMMLKPGNLLCLDEPTNHLDIPAKEILEEACRNYEGSILLVSHDR
jgi:ATPase subunit of ABC transporter with duplicated ATPase domains